MEIAAVTIFNIADLDHKIYKVLDAEYPIEVNKILLIYVLHEVPELIDHLYLMGIDPEIA